MRKVKYLIITLILLFPTIVNAEVQHDTPIRLFDTEAQCRTELEKNDATENASASNGYYLSCIAVSCSATSRVEHNDLAPLSKNVKCANGNGNPFTKLIGTAIVAGEGLDVGNICSLDEQDENFFISQYATAITQYNCLQTSTGDSYTGTPTNGGNNNNGETPPTNPQTGINTYYIILGSTVMLLSAGLYVINKKNLFKKI